MRTTLHTLAVLPAGTARSLPRSLDPAARTALRRAHLTSGVWRPRLAGAPPALIRFINRFHRVAGFDHVVRAYFRGTYRRRTALLAIRLARHLAAGRPALDHALAFEPSIGFTSAGTPAHVVDVTLGATRYRLLPWVHISPAAVRTTVAHDASLFGPSRRIHWVFDRDRMTLPRRDIARQIQRAAAAGRASTSGARRRSPGALAPKVLTL